MQHELQQAVRARESARARVRFATGAAVVAGVALTGAFTALAAGSTHLRKIVRTRTPQPAASHRHTSPVVAPVPPLVSVGGAAPAPAPSQQPSTPAPEQTQAPPVVVSSSS